jgi:molybdate transport system ATP-binding protein
MLAATLDRRLGSFRLEVTLQVPAASTLVLVGESGSGKTTTLRLLAGLLEPDAGRIALEGAIWYDTSSGIDLPAPDRAVGWVPQDYALFPHLSVAENVAFGLRADGIAPREVKKRVARALERFGLASVAARRPSQISGGQQQRTALARALVLEPPLLLLDEPLAALDLATRRAVRGELKSLLEGLPCVTLFVTHSPMEALVFGDRIAVLEEGRISQEGPREDLLRHPRSGYVAELMGLNLFRGRVITREPGGMIRVATEGGALTAVDPGGGDELMLVVDPREVTLHLEPPGGSAQNLLHGTIAEIVPQPPLGDRLRVVLDSHPPLVAEITPRAAAALGLTPGMEVIAAFKASGVRAYR